jgi:hypothetical protein
MVRIADKDRVPIKQGFFVLLDSLKQHSQFASGLNIGRTEHQRVLQLCKARKPFGTRLMSASGSSLEYVSGLTRHA